MPYLLPFSCEIIAKNGVGDSAGVSKTIRLEWLQSTIFAANTQISIFLNSFLFFLNHAHVRIVKKIRACKVTIHSFSKTRCFRTKIIFRKRVQFFYSKCFATKSQEYVRQKVVSNKKGGNCSWISCFECWWSNCNEWSKEWTPFAFTHFFMQPETASSHYRQWSRLPQRHLLIFFCARHSPLPLSAWVLIADREWEASQNS